MRYRNSYECHRCDVTFMVMMDRPTYFGRCHSCDYMHYPVMCERIVE